jgi:hypothetical protein
LASRQWTVAKPHFINRRNWVCPRRNDSHVWSRANPHQTFETNYLFLWIMTLCSLIDNYWRFGGHNPPKKHNLELHLRTSLKTANLNRSQMLTPLFR